MLYSHDPHTHSVTFGNVFFKIFRLPPPSASVTVTVVGLLLILLILYIGKYIISIISIIGIIGIISIAACYWWFYMNIIDDILAWGISIMVFYYLQGQIWI